MVIIGSGALAGRLMHAVGGAGLEPDRVLVTPTVAALRSSPPDAIILSGSAVHTCGRFCRALAGDRSLRRIPTLVLAEAEIALELTDLPNAAVLAPDLDPDQIAPLIVGLCDWPAGADRDGLSVSERTAALLGSAQQYQHRPQSPAQADDAQASDRGADAGAQSGNGFAAKSEPQGDQRHAPQVAEVDDAEVDDAKVDDAEVDDGGARDARSADGNPDAYMEPQGGVELPAPQAADGEAATDLPDADANETGPSRSDDEKHAQAGAGDPGGNHETQPAVGEGAVPEPDDGPEADTDGGAELADHAHDGIATQEAQVGGRDDGGESQTDRQPASDGEPAGGEPPKGERRGDHDLDGRAASSTGERPAADDKELPAATAADDELPAPAADDEEPPVVARADDELPAAEADDEKRAVATTDDEGQPTAAAADEKRAVVTAANEDRSATDEQSPTAAAADEVQAGSGDGATEVHDNPDEKPSEDEPQPPHSHHADVDENEIEPISSDEPIEDAHIARPSPSIPPPLPAQRDPVPAPAPLRHPGASARATRKPMDWLARASGFAALLAVLLLLYRDQQAEPTQPPAGANTRVVGSRVDTNAATEPGKAAGAALATARANANVTREATPAMSTSAVRPVSTPTTESSTVEDQAEAPSAASQADPQQEAQPREPAKAHASEPAPPADKVVVEQDESAKEASTAAADERETPDDRKRARRTQARVLVDDALYYLRATKYERACEIFEEAAKIDPHYPRALAGAARAYLKKGDAATAVRFATRVSKVRSKSSANHLLLGDALKAAGQNAEAAGAWQRAVELGSNTAKARLSPKQTASLPVAAVATATAAAATKPPASAAAPAATQPPAHGAVPVTTQAPKATPPATR